MTRSLRLPVFRRLLAAYVFNELAWSVGTLALSVLVYRRTGSALGTAVFFICSQFMPALLSPVMVSRLDRAALRRVLPALYALEAVLFGVLAWFTSHFTLGPVLALTLADGIVAATARSLASAARTETLKEVELLPEGNAVTNVCFSVAYMAGPVGGGLVVAAGGTIAALLVNCGFFAVMALVLALTSLPEARTDPVTGWDRLLVGMRHVRSDPLLSRLITLQTLGLVFFTITLPVEVVFAQHTLNAGPGGYGALMGAWGAGAVAGSAAYARWRRSSTAVLVSSAAVSLAIGFALTAVAPALPLALVGSAIAGAGNGVEGIAVRTAVQERTPSEWMALTISFNDSLSQVAPGAGILLGGLITSLATARTAFGVAAAGSLAFAIAAPLVLRAAARTPAGKTAPGGPASGAGNEPEAASERSLV